MNENTGPDVQVIENARLKDVRPGDHVIWEAAEMRGGVTVTARREGIAHHRDKWGDWCTEGGVHITGGEGEGDTLTLRRPGPVKQEPGR